MNSQPDSIYASIVEQTDDLVYVTTKDGTIEYVNPACEKYTGYTKEELLGKKPSILKSDVHPAEFYKNLWDTILAGMPYRGVVINRKKNGEFYYEDKTITPLKNETGEILYFIATGKDITERKKLEAQLIQSQKLESIGVLSSGIAHEINNVLAMVLHAAELLLLNISHEAKKEKYANIIIEAAQRGASIVKQLLMFARQGEINLQPLAAAQVIEKVLTLCSHTLPKAISVHTKIETNNDIVRGDETLLYQVLLNLIINARDAMPNGGALTVEMKFIPNASVRRIFSNSVNSDYLAISVSDSGMGMDTKTKQRIFDPFFSTKEPGKGTGLGLSMAYEIIKTHNGFIDVQSELNIGTTFTIYLPLCPKSN